MDSSAPGIACVMLVAVVFVLPMYLYIVVTEGRAKRERAKSIEAGRNEPVTIQPYIDPAVCMGSGACATACPEHVLSVIEGQAVAVNLSACIGHGACVTMCPVGAIELVFGSEKRGIDIPRVGPDFQTNVRGMFVAGELGGMGLIANATEQGTKALKHAVDGLRKSGDRDVVDVAIVGAGPAGMAATAAAIHGGFSYALLEQDEFGGAMRHYPRKKLVFTRPMDILGYPRVNVRTLHKEQLVDTFRDVIEQLGIVVSTQERVDKIAQRAGGGFTLRTTKREVHAQRVLLCLGRRGTPRKLGAKGEDVEKVAYSLLEPERYKFDHLLVVGGGDSAVEAAIQLSEEEGNKVTLSYRGDKINRPKEKNLHRLEEAQRRGRVDVRLESEVKEILQDRVIIEQRGETSPLANDYVFVLVGGILPTKFLQDAGIQIEKHFGKRIEIAEDTPDAPRPAVPQERPKAAPPPPAEPQRGGSAPTLPPQWIQGNDEVTVWLGSGGIDELALDTAFAGSDEATAPRAASEELPAACLALAKAARLRLDAGAYSEAERLATELTRRLAEVDADGVDDVRRVARLIEAEARLGAGDDVDVAAARFGEAAEDARAAGDSPSLAWATRGLALARMVQGRPRDALRTLSEALGLLGRDSDPALVGPILGDAVVLEITLGRYAAALGHTAALLEWTPSVPAQHLRALALRGETFAAAGARGPALEVLAEALALVPAVLGDAGAAADAKLRTARLAAGLGRLERARTVLDALGRLPDGGLSDLAGQAAALWARIEAPTDPDAAWARAGHALDREGPLSPLDAAALAIDAARALLDAGHPVPARIAAKRGLKVVPGADPKGVRLELLAVLLETDPDDPQVREAVGRTAARVRAELPPDLAAALGRRPDLAAALDDGLPVARDPVTRPLAVPRAR